MNNLDKTPNFNKAISGILEELKPHQQNCKQCGAVFDVLKEDIEFYKKMMVSGPTLCPLCRKKRRFGQMMRIPKFFKKRCQAPGHNEEVITIFPPSSPHKVFDFNYWHSDNWQATDFGRDYDFSQKFFEQFKKLFFDMPHVPLEKDQKAKNCDYMVGGTSGNNIYYTAMGFHSENICYGFDNRYSRDLVDCNVMVNSELCYNSVDSYNCNRCVFVISCNECLDSAFLYECKNCSNCFMSANLHNKSYVFKNKQLSKKEYEKQMDLINLGDRSVFNENSNYFKEEVFTRALHRSIKNINTYQSIGDDLKNCQKCYFVFRAENSENIRFSDLSSGFQDSMDTSNAVKTELSYEAILNLQGRNNKFSIILRNCSDMEYSSECFNCSNCFGCVGLKNKEFHILNQPYEEKEYWFVLDKIKTKMLEDGEYGEFFPLYLGLMPYQSSTGQKYFPLNEEEAKKQNIPWYEEPEPSLNSKAEILKAPDEVPIDIKEVGDDILNKVILYEKTKKPFQIIERELDFYRKMNLPIPTKHPLERMAERTEFERFPWLFPFKCPKCGEESFSSYSLEKQKEYKIYCEKCYLKEVI